MKRQRHDFARIPFKPKEAAFLQDSILMNATAAQNAAIGKMMQRQAHDSYERLRQYASGIVSGNLTAKQAADFHSDYGARVAAEEEKEFNNKLRRLQHNLAHDPDWKIDRDEWNEDLDSDEEAEQAAENVEFLERRAARAPVNRRINFDDNPE